MGWVMDVQLLATGGGGGGRRVYYICGGLWWFMVLVRREGTLQRDGRLCWPRWCGLWRNLQSFNPFKARPRVI